VKTVYLILLILMLILGLLNHFSLIDSDTLLLLRYEPSLIHNHEYWRLLSAHFVHLNLIHAFMNLGALCLLMIIFWKDMSYSADLVTLLFSIFGINIGLYFFHPELASYAGFSGVLHGLFIYYFLKILPENKTSTMLSLSLLTAKVVWEQSPWSDTSETAKLIGGSVATMAHFYGGICGLLAGTSYLVWQRRHLIN
jgi:rhomboid family GlyGly-CTERM serine protease